ncbi:MAG: hypothetical protein IT332_06770 [Ardenticatenales bacterium]|nr:hypothetical protein [Ardenticatenales bacterium]
MNVRGWIGRVAIALFTVGALLWVARLNRQAPPVATIVVAVANRAVAPYTLLTMDMLAAGQPMREVEARNQGAYPLEGATGLMTTAPLAPGDVITTDRALPATDVRFIRDLRLEIVSFAAGVDRLVGGRVRPGHRINIYGTGRDRQNRRFTELIERAALVVQVSAAGQAVMESAAVPDLTTGEVRRPAGAREPGVTMVTVALLPTRVLHLVDALSSRRLDPWVTLAAIGQADIAPVATEGLPTPPVFQVPVDPGFAATVTTTPVAIGSLGAGGTSRTPSAPDVR